MATQTTQKKKKKFLEVYAETGNVSLATQAIGVNRATPYKWRKTDEKFAQAWDQAAEEAADKLEQEAWRRAVQGVEKPVYYKGKLIDKVREYSDTLLIFLLKGFRPEKYSEKQEIKHSGGLEFKIKLPDDLK